jgi:hypothetical protein
VLTAPALNAKIEYRALTNDGTLRHPHSRGCAIPAMRRRFIGYRIDQVALWVLTLSLRLLFLLIGRRWPLT